MGGSEKLPTDFNHTHARTHLDTLCVCVRVTLVLHLCVYACVCVLMYVQTTSTEKYMLLWRSPTLLLKQFFQHNHHRWSLSTMPLHSHFKSHTYSRDRRGRAPRKIILEVLVIHHRRSGDARQLSSIFGSQLRQRCLQQVTPRSGRRVHICYQSVEDAECQCRIFHVKRSRK